MQRLGNYRIIDRQRKRKHETESAVLDKPTYIEQSLPFEAVSKQFLRRAYEDTGNDLSDFDPGCAHLVLEARRGEVVRFFHTVGMRLSGSYAASYN